MGWSALSGITSTCHTYHTHTHTHLGHPEAAFRSLSSCSGTTPSSLSSLVNSQSSVRTQLSVIPYRRTALHMSTLSAPSGCSCLLHLLHTWARVAAGCPGVDCRRFPCSHLFPHQTQMNVVTWQKSCFFKILESEGSISSACFPSLNCKAPSGSSWKQGQSPLSCLRAGRPS